MAKKTKTKKRKIAVVTGTRGEYGIYSSVLDAIDKRKDLDYSLIVTCMHLSKEFGYTVKEIEKDKRKIGAKVHMLKYEDTGAGMAKNTGVALIGITKAIQKIKPDVILVLGDRDEQLAGAMAGAHMNIPVAHLHGGEVSGTIDESIRHAITRFAHVHLPATKKSRERLIKMGERPENIYLVGSPGIDSIRNGNLMSREKIAKKFKFDPNKKIVLALQYPVTTEFNQAKKNMQSFMESLVELGEQTVYVYSNSDAGYTKMMKVADEYIKKNKFINMHRSLNHDVYLSVMKNSDLMIGNSSSGVIEAPSCKTPYILVGTRQQGREKAKSIIEVNYDKNMIMLAAKRALKPEFMRIVRTCEKPYDPFKDGRSGNRVAEVLAKLRITPKLIQKRIAY
jgi:UDP-N-acetylglucosamine 2-epimerase (non-hydrolysing)/GDP/UDP-N,N'-diacetylbacillosamine 2-epimerase (hydrolysing)